MSCHTYKEWHIFLCQIFSKYSILILIQEQKMIGNTEVNIEGWDIIING